MNPESAGMRQRKKTMSVVLARSAGSDDLIMLLSTSFDMQMKFVGTPPIVGPNDARQTDGSHAGGATSGLVFHRT
jgi:hypothetical protein